METHERAQGVMTQEIIEHLRRLTCLSSSVSTYELKEVLGQVSAADLMGACVRAAPHLLEVSREVRNTPGGMMWPIPLFFPSILARTLLKLEQETRSLRETKNWETGRALVKIRQLFVQLSCSQDELGGEKTSDLSGDHCGVFLNDHPEVKKIAPKDGPWWNFCQTLLSEDDVFVLMGMVGDNEDGSEEEQYALLDTGIIVEGDFYNLHTVAEVEHAEIEEEIESIIASNPAWEQKYLWGKVCHRVAYAFATNVLRH